MTHRTPRQTYGPRGQPYRWHRPISRLPQYRPTCAQTPTRRAHTTCITRAPRTLRDYRSQPLSSSRSSRWHSLGSTPNSRSTPKPYRAQRRHRPLLLPSRTSRSLSQRSSSQSILLTYELLPWQRSRSRDSNSRSQTPLSYAHRSRHSKLHDHTAPCTGALHTPGTLYEKGRFYRHYATDICAVSFVIESNSILFMHKRFKVRPSNGSYGIPLCGTVGTAAILCPSSDSRIETAAISSKMRGKLTNYKDTPTGRRAS